MLTLLDVYVLCGKTCRRSQCSQSLSLFPVQNGYRSRPARVHRHRTPPWYVWARSSDNVLPSWPYQLSHFSNFWSCWARKMEGAELSPSCTQHIVSPCVWYQHTSVNGMSILLVSGILRSRAIQRSEHMLRGRRASSWPTARVNM